MDVVSIFLVLLLISASVLCIGTVVYLNRITKSVKEIESDVKQLTSEVKPLAESFTVLSDNLNGITGSVRDQVDMTKEIVTNVKDRVDQILLLEEKIRGGFEVSALDLIKNLSAISNGVSAFWNAYKKK
jgi:uncharacterized protein YoxC